MITQFTLENYFLNVSDTSRIDLLKEANKSTIEIIERHTLVIVFIVNTEQKNKNAQLL